MKAQKPPPEKCAVCGRCAAFSAAPASTEERWPQGFGRCAYLPKHEYVSPRSGCRFELSRWRPRLSSTRRQG